MMQTKLKVLVLALSVFTGSLQAQKMLSDGSVVYSVSVEKGKEQAGIAEAFDGATLTVQFKGTQVRSDLNSRLRQQTIFYNSKTGNAVILKESGNEKYMINLAPPQWQQYNKKYEAVSFNSGPDTKVIQGFNCTKATATLKDGTIVTVYYAVDLKPVATGYEYVFSNLPGLPLEYELTTGNIQVKYSASSVQMSPVNASRFDLPTSGYKILDFKQ
jgi:GLPGLI family protein